jgi:hypothetical protein
MELIFENVAHVLWFYFVLVLTGLLVDKACMFAVPATSTILVKTSSATSTAA